MAFLLNDTAAGRSLPVLRLSGIRVELGGAPLLDGADLEVAAGDRIALVGRNGSGKSTLLRIAEGTLEPSAGERWVQPGTVIRTLPQEPDFTGHPTALAYVHAGQGPADDPHLATRLLEATGIAPAADPRTLSGGQGRRLALARVLAASPDLLLADEPTNHLDMPGIEWLEAQLAAVRTLVLISHDRRLLERAARTTVWLDRGRTRRLAQGFAAFEAWRDTLLTEEETARHKLDRQIAREEDWMRYGVTARRKRNVRRVAELAALRQDRREWRSAEGTAKLAAQTAPGSGSLVIEAERAGFSYGPRPIVRDLTLKVRRGDRIGIVGANGVGKTTLVNLLTGRLPPDSGAIRLGTNLVTATLDQARAALNPAATLADIFTGGGGDMVQTADGHRHVAGVAKDFLFGGGQLRTPVGRLSGGERARLLLALALIRSSNLLLLDEPTNDLDLETLDLLQETLAAYRGTVLLVSHDRDFLDRTVTATLAPAGDGRWALYDGGYSAVPAAAPPPASRPARPPARPAPPPKAPQDREGLSFKERHQLERLPARIEALTQAIAKARDLLSDPDFYGRDPAGFAAAGATLAAAQAELEAAESAWLELTLKQES